jgi:hypothetical protein
VGLTLLRLIPIWVWPLLLVGAWGFYGNYKSTRLEKERTEANAEAQRLSARVGQIKREEARQVEAQYAQKLKAAKVVSDKLRASESGLRDQLANNTARDSVAICGVDGERGRILEELLTESAGLARAGAEEVVRLGAKTAALQDHIKRVCVGTKDANHKD